MNMNDLVPQKTFLQRNKKWLIVTSLLLFFATVIFVISGGTENASNYLHIYSDTEVYQNAVLKANENPRVAEVLGALEPIDNLAIAEGNVVYSNENTNLEMTTRINGDKGKGKIQIIAEKTGDVWNYESIIIRIKNPEEEITIID